MKILDQMMKARGDALTKGQKPKSWNLNPAVLSEIAMDERITNIYMDKPFEEYPFMGIPIRVTDNRSDEWRFSLEVYAAEIGFVAHATKISSHGDS